MACNFEIENNKIKLLTEYENVTQKVLILAESMLQNAKQLQHARLS
jgi:archaellum component FlaC